ncbi:MAG: TolC family outer membrane protein [Methylophilaceae bacterium]
MSHQLSAQDLMQTYQQVLTSDPRLLIDSLGVEVGVARERQSFGQLLPQASLSSSATSTTRRASERPIDHYSGQRYIFSVRQPLFDMQKYSAWKQSTSVKEQFKYQYEDTQSLVRLDTVERYFGLLKAQGELALMAEEKAVVAEKKRQIEALFEKRLVKITQLYEVIARLDMLEADYVELKRLLDLAKANLSELTGRPIQLLAPLSDNQNAVEPMAEVDDYVALVSERNAALNASLKKIEVARRHLKKQKAGHYPIIDLQFTKQETNIGFESSVSPVTDTEVVSVNLSMPIFSGGSTSAGIYEATQQLAIAKASYDQENRRIKKELTDEYLNVKSIKRRISATQKSVESAEKSYRAMEQSFKYAIATVSEVLDAQQVLLQSKQNNLQVNYDYVISKTRFLYKAGLLTDDVLVDINARLK